MITTQRIPSLGIHPGGTAQSVVGSTSCNPTSRQGAKHGPSTGLPLRWEGAQFSWHSLAHVNRELCLALLNTGQVDLSLWPTEPPWFTADEDYRFPALEERFFAPPFSSPVAHVRHFFPPRLDPPGEGALVLIQPWEYGFLPEEWIDPILRNVHEVWCYSEYVREVYRASGIPADRLHLVPLGVNPAIFHPAAPPYVFDEVKSKKSKVKRGSPSGPDLFTFDFLPLTSPPGRFTFLYAGGTLHRKGIDVLLDAYLRAFSALDPVCLVVKDTCTRTVYRDDNARDRILALAEDPSRPPIVYLDDDLTAHQLAGVYTACDCLVQPYRGEGFCLPALEAMACGLPVVATAGGPTDDFLDDTVGWRLPADRRPLPGRQIGPWACVDHPWMFEPSVEELARLLREIAAHPEEAARRGAAATERAHASWTWQHAAETALTRLRAIAEVKSKKSGTRSAGDGKRAGLGTPAGSRTPATPSGSPSLVGKGPGVRSLPDSSLIPHPSSLKRLSVCLIARNEERVLAACLRSLLPWADEIVLVDTGSTDRTVEIAQGFAPKLRLFHFPWCDDFAAARNESLRHAVMEWILWVDCDDTLPWKSGEAIRAALGAPPEVAGFVIPVQFVEDGSRAGGTRVDHVKLFRNLPGVRFEGRIHEQVLPSLRQHGEVARLDAVVLHSGYDTSPAGQARKRERDEKLLALDLAERPDHPFVLFNRGMTDHYAADHEAAVAALRRSIEFSRPQESQLRKAWALLAVSLRELGRRDEALQAVRDGLAAVPGDPELHFHAGLLLTNAGRFPEAKAHYLETLQADISGHFSSVDVGILGYKTYHNLGGVCRLMDDYDAARDWWLKAIEAAPEFLPSAFELFNAALEHADLPTAERMVAAVRRVEGPGDNWVRMGARLAEATGGDPERHRFLEAALLSGAPPPTAAPTPQSPISNLQSPHPHTQTARLLLARSLLEKEQVAAAEPHLRSLEQEGVAEAAYYLGVTEIRRGDFPAALRWMERALELNPDHAPTAAQVANLRRALAAEAGAAPPAPTLAPGQPRKRRNR